MTPSPLQLNREGMENVPGYAASVQKKDNEEDWMLKALDVIERSLLLLKGVELYDEDESDPDDPSRLRYHLDPDEQMWHDEADADLRERTNDLMGYLQNMSPEEKLEVTRAQGNPLLSGVLEGELGACKDGVCGHDEEDELHQNNIRQADQFLLESMMESWMPDAADHGLSGIEFQDMDREAFPQGQSKDWTAEEGFRAHAVNPLHWRKLAGEPIDIALQLLKAPVMPGRAGFPEDDPETHDILGSESGTPLLSANELYELAALGYGEGADPEIVEHYLGEKRPLTDKEHDDIIDGAIDQTIGEGEPSHQQGSHSHEENAAQFEREGGRLVDFGYGFSGFGALDGEGNEIDLKTRPMVGPLPANRAVPHFPNTPINPQILGNVPWPDGFTTDNKSEPMNIALQLLKERKSPEAWANKKRYDSEYQKNPKRVKYREQLNAERRKRGIYGKGGKDVSHTQGGKLTLESAHANRARHFKNRGTLRRVKVR